MARMGAHPPHLMRGHRRKAQAPLRVPRKATPKPAVKRGAAAATIGIASSRRPRPAAPEGASFPKSTPVLVLVSYPLSIQRPDLVRISLTTSTVPPQPFL